MTHAPSLQPCLAFVRDYPGKSTEKTALARAALTKNRIYHATPERCIHVMKYLMSFISDTQMLKLKHHIARSG